MGYRDDILAGNFAGSSWSNANPAAAVTKPTPASAYKTGSLIPISPPGPRLAFHVDPETAIRNGGAGGWVRVERPRQVAAVEWVGLPAYTLEIPLIFGVDMSTSIEADCLVLQRMARPGVPGQAPPVVTVAFHNYHGQRWVIEDILWSDEWRVNGLRVRATATVTFIEYHGLDVVGSAAQKAKEKITPGGIGSGGGSGSIVGWENASRPRTYTVRAGDTLLIISKRTGVPVAALVKANQPDRRTPLVLAPGMVLTLPALTGAGAA